MDLAFRRTTAAIVTALACLLSSGANAAYPDKPVRLLLGYPPGGSADVMARLVAQKLSEAWHQQVLVENRPGADATLAGDVVAHSPSDGYTLLFVSNNHSVPPNGFKLNYDPVKSFAPITSTDYVPNILLINANVPAHSLKEFIAYAKERPGKLNFGSGGSGTANFLDMELFMKSAAIDMVAVSYRGGATQQVAILGNEIQVMTCPPIASCIEPARDGRVRALAISGKVRTELLPDVPTYAEADNLPNYSGSVTWHGLLAPAGTPREIVTKIHDDMAAALKQGEFQKTMTAQGFVTVGDRPEDFARTIATDLETWNKLIPTIETK